MPSYERNKDSKLWSVRFREDNADGTRTNKRLSGFGTKREAQEAYEAYLIERNSKPVATGADMTFDELYSAYIRYEEQRTKETSFYDIKSKIGSLILPTFSGKKIGDITPAFILEWSQELIKSKSYNTVKWLFSYLSSIYRFGERYYNVQNVMTKVDRPRNMEPAKELPYWTPTELSAVLDALDDKPVMRMLVLFLFCTGCRKGEAFALTWQDLDLVERTVRIDKSLTVKAHDGDAAFKIVTPKTKNSVRVIPLPRFLAVELTDYWMWQIDNGTGDRFVFGGDKHLSQASVDRWFKAAILKAGVPVIHIHDLRHSFVNNMIRQGVNIVAISHQLGHKDIETTFNVYSQWMPQDDDAIRAAQDAICAGFDHCT